MPDAAPRSMSLDEFLEWEVGQDARYEFADGVIVLMAGGTERHDIARGAIYAALLRQLSGKPCRPFLDIKVVCPSGRARYPDVAVDSGPRDPSATALSQPVVVVEVLSPSTRATDYLAKSIDYASVPSVEVYLIVDPDEPRIDILRREGAALVFAETITDREAVIDLPGIGAALPLADVYPI
jgi:Uma2 family endonuclease